MPARVDGFQPISLSYKLAAAVQRALSKLRIHRHSLLVHLTTSDMTDIKQICARLIELWDADCDINVEINELRAALAEPKSATLEQGVQQMHPFVVRHYIEDERPSIKGNGFDGLEIGEDREEAEAFVAWINEKLARLGQ